METIIIICAVIFFIIYLVAQESKKETSKERYGEAVGFVAHSIANKIANVAHDIAEPASRKRIRLAKEVLANRNGRIYRFEDYTHKDRLEMLLMVDDDLKQSFDVLGLTECRWQKIAKHLFYVGVIRYLSREHSDFSKKNSELIRQHIINDWINDTHHRDKVATLKEALSYFHISEDDWIKFGDTVIEMYNLNENKDVEEFGIVTQIMPMSNNRHLL